MRDQSIIFHRGVFKRTASLPEAVFMITGMTIGAGVLGVPYVVAQVGLVTGLLYILILGAAMLALNLIIGDVAVRTKAPLQLPGFAGKYIGLWARNLVSLVVFLGASGALLAYVVGEGEVLATLFGGAAAGWSVVFWSVGAFLIWRGLQTVKIVEKIFSFTVITIIVGLSFYLFGDFDQTVWQYHNWGQIFLPYGVILFALHASPSIAEAHILLPGSQRRFKKALIIGTIIPVAVYMIFAAAVVGVTGLNTTVVATTGLGMKFGSGVVFFSNLFAFLAMGTGFIGLGVALKQSLVFDHKVSPTAATVLVVLLPLSLFMLGWRSFIVILDVVGGLFVSIEAIMMVAVCARAQSAGDLPAARYNLRWFWPLAVLALVVFTLASVYSIIKIIR